MTKEEIRKQMRTLRKKISECERKERNALLLQRLYKLTCFQNTHFFFPFVSYGTEPDTIELIHRLLEEKEKQIAVPKVQGQRMDFYYISSMDELKKGTMGILEPVSGKKAVIEEGVMLMPGLAFDRKKNRIGYGGGYYDRYLEQYDNGQFFKIAIAYDFQILEQIEVSEHDKRPDIILTDQRMIE